MVVYSNGGFVGCEFFLSGFVGCDSDEWVFELEIWVCGFVAGWWVCGFLS